MFYIYVLYSKTADKYYIGQTDDVQRRLLEHNTVIKNSFTSRYRPWILKASFEVSESRGEARRIESYLKKRRSRRTIERLIVHPEGFRNIIRMVRAVLRS